MPLPSEPLPSEPPRPEPPPPDKRLLLGALLASALLSLWAPYADPVLNPDGALYVDAAHQFLLGNWAEGQRIYPWCWYPALIAGVAWLGGMELVAAGQWLNGGLHALLVWGFLRLLWLAGAGWRVQALGALLLLIYPELNEDRASLLRGPGMWAALLLGLACLMRLREAGGLGSVLGWALGWSGWLLLAALFRVEALAYLAVMPLLLLFEPGLAWRQRLGACLACCLLPGAALAGLGTGLWLAGWSLEGLGETFRYLAPLAHAVTEDIPAKGEALTREVLHGRIEGYGTAGVYVALGVIALLAFVRRAGVLYLLLAGFLQQTAAIKHGRVFLWLLAVNLAYLLAHLAADFTVSSRYAAPAALVVLLYASFGLAALWDWLAEKRFGKAGRGLLALALLATAVDGVHSFGASKRYLRDAGEWLAGEVPAGRLLLSNDYVICHYAGVRHTHAERWVHEYFISDLRYGRLDLSAVGPGDYLAVRPEKASSQALAALAGAPGVELVKTFTGGKKRQILIYQLQPQSGADAARDGCAHLPGGKPQGKCEAQPSHKQRRLPARGRMPLAGHER